MTTTKTLTASKAKINSTYSPTQLLELHHDNFIDSCEDSFSELTGLYLNSENFHVAMFFILMDGKYKRGNDLNGFIRRQLNGDIQKYGITNKEGGKLAHYIEMFYFN